MIQCSAPGRLGRLERENGESSVAGAARSEEERGEGARPYMLNWPQVTTEFNLSTADENFEWLLNCLPPNILEYYNTFGAGSVIDLGVQPALLVSALWKKKV